MTMQMLLPLHTYPDGNSANLAQHAHLVASHLSAQVHALLLHADFMPVSNPFGSLLIDTDDLVKKAKALSRQHGAELAAAMRERLAESSISLRISEVDYLPTELSAAVIQFSKYHDMTVLGVGNHDSALRGTAEDVIFGSGRPVLLVPEDLEASGYHHVAIAWDGSRVAARAVADAWPFLSKAKSVSILTVTDEKALPQDGIGNMLATYMSQHELKSSVVGLLTEDRPIAETLQSGALVAGAGLLVMGGFGHSRMRDFVLGGATGGILRDLRMPVLASH